MQFVTAVMLALGLIASPIGCLVQPCDLSVGPHDCCPRKAGVTACPYDILSSAKASPDQHFALAPARVEVAAPYASLRPADSLLLASVLIDQRGLFLENRVLRR
jgi:hypothetical protein